MKSAGLLLHMKITSFKIGRSVVSYIFSTLEIPNFKYLLKDVFDILHTSTRGASFARSVLQNDLKMLFCNFSYRSGLFPASSKAMGKSLHAHE